MTVGLTVSDLLGQLRAMDPKSFVVMPTIGDGFTPLAAIEKANYFPVTNSMGEVYYYDPDFQDADELPAVVLKPKQ